jgi:hypothetical protein
MNTINSTQRSTEGQCIELLMQLRRSLTQQYDVRLAVYEVWYRNFEFDLNLFVGFITSSSEKSYSNGTNSWYAHFSSNHSIDYSKYIHSSI